MTSSIPVATLLTRYLRTYCSTECCRPLPHPGMRLCQLSRGGRVLALVGGTGKVESRPTASLPQHNYTVDHSNSSVADYPHHVH